MHNGDNKISGSVVRLTTPYLDAERGVYSVIYVYSNGWLGVRSHSTGARFDVPAYLCRQLKSKPAGKR